MSRRLEQLILAVAAIFISCGQVQCDIIVLPDVLYYNLTTTSRAELFIQHNQRQFHTNAYALDHKLIDFKKNFNDRLNLIALHNDEIEAKLSEVDNNLNPMILLDDVFDYCIHKYRHKLPVWATVKTALTNCMQKGTTAYAGLVSAAETTLRNLRNYYTGTMANSLKDCKKKYEKLEKNYTSCVVTVMRSAATTTFSNTNLFNNQMKVAACGSASKVKEVFDCYTTNIFNTYKVIGTVVDSAEKCISGQEFCPSCGDVDAVTKGRCPYHLSWHLGDDDLTSDKITNPFKGITKSTPCLQVNFITKGLQIQ